MKSLLHSIVLLSHFTQIEAFQALWPRPDEQQQLDSLVSHRSARPSSLPATAAAADSDDSIIDVVLFGIGDLRTDDHLGLMRALGGEKVLPLCIVNDDMLVKVPGAVAHTYDTANLLTAALEDVHSDLQAMGGALHVEVTDESVQAILEQLAVDLSIDRLRVHVCDLGDVDNGLGYGVFAHVSNSDKIQTVPWTDNLRNEPWAKVESLPDRYTAYESQYVSSTAPIEPQSIPSTSADQFVAMEKLQSLPTSEQLAVKMVKAMGLDPARCQNERNTGLYASHWGGLQPASIGGTQVLEALRAYTVDSAEKDELWFQHPKYVGKTCRPNGRSLEHASMAWQLKGDGTSFHGKAENWLSGESMVRFLAAPLLFGTVSPRRIWYESKAQALFFLSPLKRLVEGREWHRLLAAKNLRTDPAYQGQGEPIYKYWRYQGFLCRYAQTEFTENPSRNEGILLIHGFGASGAQWNKAMQELCARQDETCASQGLAPDLIGFGQAEKPAISYTGYMWDSMVMDFVKEEAIAKNGWNSFVVGGNSIGGFTSMSLAASDAAAIGSRQVSSSGAPGTSRCTGLVLMNSAGPVQTREEVDAIYATATNELQLETVAQVTALNALPACKPPPRPVARTFGNVLLAYLRPRIQSICKNLYPTNPNAVDDELCDSILRDSLDPGAINVMMAGAKLPQPRTANELLQADFGGVSNDKNKVQESVFTGPVLIAQGVLDPLNDAMDRMNRFGALRSTVTTDPIQAGHCPHDELPGEVARSMASWMATTRSARLARVPKSSAMAR